MMASATNISAQIGNAIAIQVPNGIALSGGLLDELAADQVRWAADRGEQTSDTRAVGQHQHHREADAHAGRVEAVQGALGLVLVLHARRR